MKNLRFKTEAEFIEEFGEGWRVDTKWNLLGRMDYLLGQIFDGNYNPSNTNPDATNRFWQINASMITDKPLPEQGYGAGQTEWWTEKQEKLDAYVEGPCDNPDHVEIVVRRFDKNKYTSISLFDLHRYNIMIEDDYKAKYPDKLMFKNWEVKSYMNAGSLTFDCGCVKGISAVTLRNLLSLKEKIGGEAELGEVANWVAKYKNELGL